MELGQHKPLFIMISTDENFLDYFYDVDHGIFEAVEELPKVRDLHSIVRQLRYTKTQLTGGQFRFRGFVVL